MRIHPISRAMMSLRGAKSLHGTPLETPTEAAGTLRLFTGQDFGIDATAWGKWLRKNRWVYYAGRDDPRLKRTTTA